MKIPQLLSALLLGLISISLQAQLKKGIYRTNIELLNGGTVKGYVFSLNDSSIHVTSKRRKNADTTVFIQDIKIVFLRRREGPGKGFTTGMGVGAGIGYIAGYASHREPDCYGLGPCFDAGPGGYGLGGALLGGLGGGVVGFIARLPYRSYLLNGQMARYDVLKKALLNGPRSTLERKPRKGSE